MNGAPQRGITVANGVDPESQISRAADEGYDLARVIVDWSVCEPAEGAIDSATVERYCAVLTTARERGMQSLIVLCRGTEPAWAGDEFWLRLQSPELFAAWAETAGGLFGSECQRWTTLDNPNGVALQTWLIGTRPPRRKLNIAATVRALDHMLAAHVLASDAIHSVQPGAVVGVNLFALSAYELSPMLLDILDARSGGVARADLRPWLERRRRDWYESLADTGRRERVLRRIARSAVQLEMAFPRAAGAVYLSSRERSTDVIQLDYHEPAVGRYVLAPGRRSSGNRRWLPLGERSEVAANTADLARYLTLMQREQREVWLIQNGDAGPAAAGAVQIARANGVPLTLVCDPPR